MADDNNKYQGLYCCTVPMDGVRMLNFPDGTKSGVVGLDEIFAALFMEDREVNTETAEEIVERLSGRNYIVSSARQKYIVLLLEEYGKYVQIMEKGKAVPPSPSGENRPSGENQPKKGLLSRLFGGR